MKIGIPTLRYGLLVKVASVLHNLCVQLNRLHWQPPHDLWQHFSCTSSGAYVGVFLTLQCCGQRANYSNLHAAML